MGGNLRKKRTFQKAKIYTMWILMYTTVHISMLLLFIACRAFVSEMFCTRRINHNCSLSLGALTLFALLFLSNLKSDINICTCYAKTTVRTVVVVYISLNEFRQQNRTNRRWANLRGVSVIKTNTAKKTESWFLAHHPDGERNRNRFPVRSQKCW